MHVYAVCTLFRCYSILLSIGERNRERKKRFSTWISLLHRCIAHISCMEYYVYVMRILCGFVLLLFVYIYVCVCVCVCKYTTYKQGCCYKWIKSASCNAVYMNAMSHIHVYAYLVWCMSVLHMKISMYINVYTVELV